MQNSVRDRLQPTAPAGRQLLTALPLYGVCQRGTSRYHRHRLPPRPVSWPDCAVLASAWILRTPRVRWETEPQPPCASKGTKRYTPLLELHHSHRQRFSNSCVFTTRGPYRRWMPIQMMLPRGWGLPRRTWRKRTGRRQPNTWRGW